MPRLVFRLFALSCLLIPIGLMTASCSGSSSGSPEATSSDSTGTARSAKFPSASPGPYPDRIVLSWSDDPSSSLSVSWRTDSTVTQAQAQIAPALGGPSFYTKSRTVKAQTENLHTHKVPSESVNANYHSVTFEGLAADSLYAYRVGDGTHWSEWIHARTASSQPKPFSFAYLGDAQDNVRSHWSRVIRQAYSEAPELDFMIHAGDLVNNAHRNVEWGQWNEGGGWIQKMVPNLPVPGNHEYMGYRTNLVQDTFLVRATASRSKLKGSLALPNEYSVALSATRSSSTETGGLVGEWRYSISGRNGMLQIQKEGPTGYSATMDDPLSEDEYSLQNVSVTGDTLTGEFLAEFEKQSPRNLSIHWHPQFTLPRNGPKGMKETVYYLDYQGIRVIGLNSNIRDSIRLARQTEWLEATLKEARQRENIRWTVATFHHPMFSSVEGRNDERLREKWTPIFDEYRVDIVLQGHDHTYARGQLRNMRQGVNARSPNGGTVYVNSVSGAKMYEIKSDQWEDFRGITMQRSAENTQLYQVVRVQTDTMKYRSYTATGELYDAFDLVRPGDGGPSRMIQRPPANSLERTHENTIEYAKP